METTYTPRPGSKTEAAVNFVRDLGRAASDRDICEAADIDIGNIVPILATACQHGALLRCDLPDGAGKGYKVGNGTPLPAVAVASRAAIAHREPAAVPVVKATRPVAPAAPAKAAKALKAPTKASADKGLARWDRAVHMADKARRKARVAKKAAKPAPRPGKRAVTALEVRKAKRNGHAAPQPTAPVPAAFDTHGFRCGLMSDGALLLRGGFDIEQDADQAIVTLHPVMARELVEYLRKLDQLGQAA